MPKPTLEEIEETITQWVEENTVIPTPEERQRLIDMTEEDVEQAKHKLIEYMNNDEEWRKKVGLKPNQRIVDIRLSDDGIPEMGIEDQPIQ